VRLYLVRHAQAAPGEPDELRPLTREGREQARALGERLRDENARPDALLTSPLLRARETGGELARALEIEAEPDERLAPGASVEDVRAAIEGRGERVVVVGHQPDCGEIAAALTGGGPEPLFPAGGLVVLELD
jgi:phosphohistidine phosphatase